MSGEEVEGENKLILFFFPTIKKKLYFIAKVKIALPATKHLLFLNSSGACVPSFPSLPPLRSWLLSVAFCLFRLVFFPFVVPI